MALKIPARKLTADECLAKAAENDDLADRCYDEKTRQWHLGEAFSWRLLAAQRRI